ncbi:circadian clock-controlled protein daywake-like isoform X2 [Anticarsia gemmatalis]|uniref:circadian clock-controlled protein daywake-like isoform X2 n=1 Tax=Anticarsia gemmatalis TaxID=129554 RepID=UPI003F759DCD
MPQKLLVDKCSLSDKACLVPAAQKVLPIFLERMPEYNSGADSLKLTPINFDLNGLKFTLNGATWTGLKDSVIENVEWDAGSKLFKVDFHTDVAAKGAYTADGHVMNKPINGNGELNMKLKNIQVKMTVNYDTVNKGGKEYIKPAKYSYEFDVKDSAHYDMSNLYNGDKALSDDMLGFLNGNWKAISAAFSPPLLDNCFDIVKNHLVGFFDEYAISEIAKA